MCDENLVSVDPVRLDRAACESVRLKLTSEGAPRVADASVVLFDEGRGPRSTAPRPALLLDLGAGGLADGINSLQADGGTGERLLEHFVSIRGEGSRAPPMWGLLSLSLETSSCVIYTFFQRSGNAERYAVVIRGVICGLS